MDLKAYDIIYDRAIERWDEALPLGCGKQGCLIYGTDKIRLALDRIDLWDERPNPTIFEEGFNFPHLVELVKSGKEEDWQEFKRLFNAIFTATPYPTKITAGRIELDFGNLSDVKSKVSLETATAEVHIGKKAKLEAFMSATRFAGAARVWGDFTLELHIPDYISGDENGKCGNNSGIGNKDVDYCLHYPRACVIRDGEFTYYEQKTYTDFTYGIAVLRKDYGDFSELYFTVAAGDNDPVAAAKAELEGLADIGYEALKSEHEKWWSEYWSASEISTPDKLFDKTYYRSWYLFASTSRKGFYPMPLQGVWTADNDSLPPWKGDYHHDTNTELSYQSYLKANRLPEGEVFIDYLWDMRFTFGKFAEEFFKVDGILLPSCCTLSGTAMGGWAHYSLSPAMTIWAAQSFDEYYRYTGDLSFLKTRAYPFLKAVGRAIFGLLEEKNGKLYLPLSTSPEIFDASREAYLTPNSNFDLALMRRLFKTLAEYSEILGENGDEYGTILSKLDDIALDDGKFIKLDPDKRLTESHRHFSHLMCLYPLHLINYDTPHHREIYSATMWDLEKYGSGLWVGFSFAMSAQIYAMMKKGNSAYEKLRAFCKGFVADNGFHLNGDFKGYGFSQFHYRPFTLESSFGFCDALHEMLMQDHVALEVFPAIPDEWRADEVSFKNLRSMGGVLVSAKLKKGKIVKFKLKSDKPVRIKIVNNFGRDRLDFGKTVIECKQGEIFELDVNGKTELKD